jgi:hypothetical protein
MMIKTLLGGVAVAALVSGGAWSLQSRADGNNHSYTSASYSENYDYDSTTIDATSGWQNVAYVEAGQKVNLYSWGQWTVGGPSNYVGPNGYTKQQDQSIGWFSCHYTNDYTFGTLIGRIDTGNGDYSNGNAFFVGSGTSFIAGKSGQLELRINDGTRNNDDCLRDNFGQVNLKYKVRDYRNRYSYEDNRWWYPHNGWRHDHDQYWCRDDNDWKEWVGHNRWSDADKAQYHQPDFDQDGNNTGSDPNGQGSHQNGDGNWDNNNGSDPNGDQNQQGHDQQSDPGWDQNQQGHDQQSDPNGGQNNSQHHSGHDGN